MDTKIITYSKDLNTEQINKIEEIFRICFPKDKIILIKEGMIININQYHDFHNYSTSLTATTLNNCNSYTATSEAAKTDNSTWKDPFVYTLT